MEKEITICLRWSSKKRKFQPTGHIRNEHATLDFSSTKNSTPIHADVMTVWNWNLLGVSSLFYNTVEFSSRISLVK